MPKITPIFKAAAMAMAMFTGVAGLSPTVEAAPFATIGSSRVTADNLVTEVQAPRRRVPAAKARKRGNNNAAIGAAILGIGVLGIAAAAASQQPAETVKL